MDSDFVSDVDKVIDRWQLSKENKQGFLDMRKYL